MRSDIRTLAFSSTILDMFLHWEAQTPDSIFLRQPYGNGWREYSYHEAGRLAREMASKIRLSSNGEGRNIGILSKNCAHWIIADLAVMMAGCISVPFYTTVLPETLALLIKHSEVEMLLIGKLDEGNWEQFKDVIHPDIITVTFPDYPRAGVPSWDEAIRELDEKQEIARPSMNEVCTIIYTSGTTSIPKGVVHTYGSICAAVKVAWDVALFGDQHCRFISYLPLSHVAERGVVEGGCIYSGGTISFVESIESFSQNLRDAQVTHFLAVPRIWEKFQQKIHAKLAPRLIHVLLKSPFLSDLIKKRIKRQLGLDQAKVILTGSAPISATLLEWFGGLGINIQEAYGMTENFCITTYNPIDDMRPGYAGKVFDGIEVRIDSETGEILMSGECLMLEYFKEPALTKNALRDGFLHTGDIGELTDDGFLKITGRLSDQFKTAKGKFISPSEIELKITDHNLVDQACVMGLGRSQPLALVSILRDHFADRTTLERSLKAHFAKLNAKLLNNEKIDKIVLVRENWTPENGFLTPTLKIKRRKIQETYDPLVPLWDASDDFIIWE